MFRSPKCVETMGSVPLWGNEIVQALWKHRGKLGSVDKVRRALRKVSRIREEVLCASSLTSLYEVADARLLLG